MVSKNIKSFFLHGLFAILPILVTVFIVTFTYEIIARWLRPLKNILPEVLKKIPGTEFVLVTLAILLLGFVLKLFFIKPIVHWVEGLFAKIPLVRTIYSSAKTFVDFFTAPSSGGEKRQVVLCEFPRKGSYIIGFVLGPATDNYQKLIPEAAHTSGKTFYKVFIPHSPNPTVGYFLVLPGDELIPTDMTFEEAIKAVVSCGLITPESIKPKK